MKHSQLAQGGPGQVLVDFADDIAPGGALFSVLNDDGAKGEAEADVVFADIAFHILPGDQLPPGHQEQVAPVVNEAHVQDPVAVQTVGDAVVHGDAVGTVGVVIRAGGGYRIDTLCHFRGGVQRAGAVRSSRQKTAELRWMGNFYFREGVHPAVNYLLPGDGEDGIVVIVFHGSILLDGSLHREQGGLPVQQRFRRGKGVRQHGGIRGLSIAFPPGSRGYQIRVVQPVFLGNGNDAAEGIADSVGYVAVKFIGKAHPGALPGAGRGCPQGHFAQKKNRCGQTDHADQNRGKVFPSGTGWLVFHRARSSYSVMPPQMIRRSAWSAVTTHCPFW